MWLLWLRLGSSVAVGTLPQRLWRANADNDDDNDDDDDDNNDNDDGDDKMDEDDATTKSLSLLVGIIKSSLR